MVKRKVRDYEDKNKWDSKRDWTEREAFWKAQMADRPLPESRWWN